MSMQIIPSAKQSGFASGFFSTGTGFFDAAGATSATPASADTPTRQRSAAQSTPNDEVTVGQKRSGFFRGLHGENRSRVERAVRLDSLVKLIFVN
jgi:hypothetical protein